MCYTNNMTEWDKEINYIADVIEQSEQFNRVLGEIAYNIYQKHGTQGLKDFSSDLQELRGIKRSLSTLRNKAWVYEKTKDLNIPNDVPFSIIQILAGWDNREEWINKLYDEGLTINEFCKAVREEKKKNTKKTKKLCPKCGAEIDS